MSSKRLKKLYQKVRADLNLLHQEALSFYVKDSYKCNSAIYRNLLLEIKRVKDKLIRIETALREWEEAEDNFNRHRR